MSKPATLRIIHVLWSLGRGGAERRSERGGWSDGREPAAGRSSARVDPARGSWSCLRVTDRAIDASGAGGDARPGERAGGGVGDVVVFTDDSR